MNNTPLFELSVRVDKEEYKQRITKNKKEIQIKMLKNQAVYYLFACAGVLSLFGKWSYVIIVIVLGSVITYIQDFLFFDRCVVSKAFLKLNLNRNYRFFNECFLVTDEEGGEKRIVKYSDISKALEGKESFVMKSRKFQKNPYYVIPNKYIQSEMRTFFREKFENVLMNQKNKTSIIE